VIVEHRAVRSEIHRHSHSTRRSTVPTRREFLKAAAAFGVFAVVPGCATLRGGPRFTRDPFTLGVASGYPTATGVVIWTRLAPEPLAPGGGMPPEVVAVEWEIAEDDQMRRVVQSGTDYASPGWAHSVHVEVTGLAPDRWYWYRFHAGGATSPLGRTRTAAAPGSTPARLRFAVASCQHYEHGYFGAYRHMLADELDLIVHVGDYIYESSWGSEPVRSHGFGEPYTVDDYRVRHALYKTDPDLQAAHGSAPWLLTWDDHEVDNDYANARSEELDRPELFLLRRAAAYQAYYEHMPLPRRAIAMGPYARLYARVDFGQLVRFHVLDDRQYRDPQACPRPGSGGSNVVGDCSERLDPGRTLLGHDQEAWLRAGVAGENAPRWDAIAQQTRIAPLDLEVGDGERYWTDGWDGYPAARARLLDALSANPVRNPLLFGGDVHSFWVTDLHAGRGDLQSPIVAPEFVGTSITSQAPGQAQFDRAVAENPHVRFANGAHRGYLRVALGADRATVDLRALESVIVRDARCNTLATFVVEDGTHTAVKA
jgi:alkaline phosphatase D